MRVGVRIKPPIYFSKWIIIIAIFCSWLMISSPYEQIVPIVPFVTANDSDSDGMDDILENTSYYKFFEDNSTMQFNGDQGSQQGNGWTHYDFMMNIIRPKYRFSINVVSKNNTGYLYILVGDEGNIEMNHSMTIDQTGEISTFLIPTSSDLTQQYTRVRLNSNLNFSINRFLMESNTDWNNSDTDSDGLSDGVEDSNFNQNTDPWETSPLMYDTDGDGLNDGAEIDNGTDPLDADSDGDGLGDYYEVIQGYNPLSNDTDSDDLSDYDEINTHNTNCTNNDTDGDGLTDGQEVLTYDTDPLDTDSDDDNLSDYIEIFSHSTDPNDADTDGDGYSDGIEILQYYTNPLNATEDQDSDGLIDPLEASIGTNRTLVDTDGDTLTDYFEYETGWMVTVNGNEYSVNPDPTEKWTSGEGLYDDYQEYVYKTDPEKPDTDGDGLNDNSELVIFRTNAEDVNQDGEFEYNVQNVWISTNRPRTTIGTDSQDLFLLHNFDYSSSAQVNWSGKFSDMFKLVSVTIEGYNVYCDKTLSTYPMKAYIFYDDPDIEMSLDDEYYNVWIFDSSSQQITNNENEKQSGAYSYLFLKNSQPAYSSKEVFLNSTQKDMDSDGLFDGEEFKMDENGGSRTNPLSNDTDSDRLSDYSEHVHSCWGTEYWTNFSLKDTPQYWNTQYLNPVVADIDSDGLLDGEEVGVQFRTNVYEDNYANNTWVSINNNTLLYSSTSWMAQFSGNGEYNETIQQSISENYTSMIAYGYAGVYTNFTSTSELGYLLLDRTIYWDSTFTVKATHSIYQYNASTIMIDVNSTDGEAYEYNVTSNGSASAVITPFSSIDYGQYEVVNFSLWTNPFCDDSDGDALSDDDEISLYGSYVLDSDPDDDGLNDYYEVQYNSSDAGYTPFNGTSNMTDLNPHNPDTDGDGLWDGERIMEGNNTVHIGELSYVANYPDTDPLNNDTDDDGLYDGYMEGGEKVSMSYRSTKIIPINESNGESIAYINTTNARDDGDGGYGYLGYMNITLEAAISYNHSHDLSVTFGCIWENDTTTVDDNWTITNDLGPGNSTYFVSYTLFDKLNYINNWQGVLSIGSTLELWKPVALGHWYVKVEDGTTTNSSEPGSIERFDLYIDMRTDPNEYDSDNDSLSDWEEVTFGDYGWFTNPWDWDTDLDSLTDYEEITGTGEALKPSNPTSNDTDGDGTWDNWDLDPTGNAYFTFEFSRVKLVAGLDDESDGDFGIYNEIYPVIKSSYYGGNFSTSHAYTVPFDPDTEEYMIVQLVSNQEEECPEGEEDNWTIHIDVADNYLTSSDEKHFYCVAYEEDDGEDDLYRLNSSSNLDGVYTIEYDIAGSATQAFISDIQTGTKVQFWFNVTKSVVTKKNTILVLPTNDTCSKNATMGTTNSGDDKLRFTVPDMSFAILMVNVTETGSGFIEGMNTILIPTPILFSSQFWNMTNSTNQANVSADLPGYMVNANWTMYNSSEVTSQITYLISFTCNSSEASELLSHFLHNATGNKTCWYEEITEDIYTVGLPYHVTNFLPADYVEYVSWPGPGEDPEEEGFLSSVGNAVCSVGSAINGAIKEMTGIDLVYVFNTVASIAVAAANWGLGAIKDPVGALNDIKNFVINAFLCLYEWIKGKVTGMFSSIVEKIVSSSNQLYTNLNLSLHQAIAYISWFDDDNYNNFDEDTISKHEVQTTNSILYLFTSLFGLEEKSDQLIERINKIFNFVNPYTSIVSPMKIVKILAKIISRSSYPIPNVLNKIDQWVDGSISAVVNGIMNVFNSEILIGGVDVGEENFSISESAFTNFGIQLFGEQSRGGIWTDISDVFSGLLSWLFDDNEFQPLAAICLVASLLMIYIKRGKSPLDEAGTFLASFGMLIMALSYFVWDSIILDFFTIALTFIGIILFSEGVKEEGWGAKTKLEGIIIAISAISTVWSLLHKWTSAEHYG